MPLPNSIDDREYARFEEIAGKTGVTVSSRQPDGEVYDVSVINPPSVNQFNQITALAGLATADVLTYTVPALKTLILKSISVSGQNRAIWSIKAPSTISKKLTWWTKFNEEFFFNDLEFTAGTIIKVEVQNASPESGDFNANIQGMLKDA